MIDIDLITAFDVETWGREPQFALQPFRLAHRDAWLNSAAVAWVDEGMVLSDVLRKPAPEQLADWLDVVIAAGHFVLCWNTVYDVACLLGLDRLQPELGIREKVYKVNWLDGMLLYRHAINAPRYREEGRMSLGLKEAVRQFYPAEAGYEDNVLFDPQTEDDWARLLTYNRRDSSFALRIARALLQTLPPETVRNALIEARCIPLVAETRIDGIPMNAAKAAARGEACQEERNAALVELSLREGMLEWDKIIASPLQLRKLLYKDWGLPVSVFTDTNQPSTDKEALAILAVEDPRAGLIHKVRENTYLKTKFCDGVVNSLEYNGDGRSRPEFRIFGTYTGRGTYSSKVGRGKDERPSGVAIHQWKNDPAYREPIEAPEDHDIIEADFAGQEFRWMAVESGDAVMLGLCEPGEDAHAYMAHRIQPALGYREIQHGAIADEPRYKSARKLGKVGNLSCQYRTFAPTLRRVAAVQHKVALTEDEARAIVMTYRTTYRGVPKYWARQIARAKAMGYVETLAGRRVYVGHPSTWSGVDENGVPYDWKWAHESTALNFPIQGIGADQKYLALLVMRDYLPRVDGRFLMELHDGVFFTVPKRYSERAAREIRQLLSNLPYKRAWGVDLPIQFPVDVKLGPNWGALKEIKD